jgi:hypothetical protein
MSEEFTPRTVEAGRPIEESRAISKGERPDVPGLPGASKEAPIEEKPLALLEKPHLIEVMGLEDLYEKDINYTKRKVEVIDTWLKTMIKEREWKANVKSYVDLLAEVKEKLGISENELPLTVLNRLFDILDKALDNKKLSKELGLKLIPTFSGFE